MPPKERLGRFGTFPARVLPLVLQFARQCSEREPWLRSTCHCSGLCSTGESAGMPQGHRLAFPAYRNSWRAQIKSQAEAAPASIIGPGHRAPQWAIVVEILGRHEVSQNFICSRSHLVCNDQIASLRSDSPSSRDRRGRASREFPGPAVQARKLFQGRAPHRRSVSFQDRFAREA